MKRLGMGLFFAIGGYLLAALVGYLLIGQFSSNTHDRTVEAAMTSAFVLGPLGAAAAFIVGFKRGGRSTPEDPMPLTELNHYFVRAKDLELSRRFYCDALGFEEMPRPDFPFPGYWLGVNGRIQVHMGLDGIPGEEAYYFGTTTDSARNNAGVIDHIAFLATEPERFAQRLQAIGLAFRERYFAEIKLFQIFVTDPDGLTIELNFPDIAAQPAWSGARAA